MLHCIRRYMYDLSPYKILHAKLQRPISYRHQTKNHRHRAKTMLFFYSSQKNLTKVMQSERRVPMYLLEVGYSECTYGYSKCWKWPLTGFAVRYRSHVAT